MADFIVNGLRINWAGNQANHFYEKSMHFAVPAEPHDDHPPEVAAFCLDDKNAAAITDAATTLTAEIAAMDSAMRKINKRAVVRFVDGRKISGKEIRRIWARCTYMVNDFKSGRDRGGATLAKLKQSQIRFSTIQGYAADSQAALRYIILHEQMHMTIPGVAFWLEAYDDYRDDEGRSDPEGEKYDGEIVHFRRTEQHVNAATREVMKLAGFDLLPQKHVTADMRFHRENMPPYGYDLEPIISG